MSCHDYSLYLATSFHLILSTFLHAPLLYILFISLNSLTCLPRPAPRASEDGVTISVDLLSSWGDEFEFGLTEVQLFDAKGRWIILRAESLSVEGAMEETGRLTVHGIADITLSLYLSLVS